MATEKWIMLRLKRNASFFNNETTKQRDNETTLEFENQTNIAGSGPPQRISNNQLPIGRLAWFRTRAAEPASCVISDFKKGFSLVELIVSLAITSIIMVGMSSFFASSFHNIFITQENLTAKQGQFATNEIIQSKLSDMDKIVEEGTDYVVFKNKITNDQLPFTYIGTKTASSLHLVFKDFFVFNDVEIEGSSIYFGNSGEGTIMQSPATIKISNIPKNFTGFAKKTGEEIYYVAVPSLNKIQVCNPACADLDLGTGIGELNSPMDVEINGNDIFISDAGNNRIIKYNVSTSISQVIATELNYPTGLTYYEDNDSNAYLFVSDTYNNQIKRINLSDNSIITVAGEGASDACDSTAKYCKLNFPTGLFADSANHTLYISDTGSNRILKMNDPGSIPSSYKVGFTLNNPTQISQINFTFPVAASGITVKSNTLHAGKYNDTENIKSYLLSATIANGNITRQECSGGEIPHCEDFFDGFTVPEGDNVFENDDPIRIIDSADPAHTNAYTIDDNNAIRIQDVTETIGYSTGSVAKVTESFSGDYQFDFDLTGAIFTKSFNTISTEVFDGTGVSIAKSNQILVIGDNILGTPEDEIKVVYDKSNGVNWPTGIGVIPQTPNDVYVYANTGDNDGKENLIISTGANKDIIPFSSKDITNFDYTSDFEIESLIFSELDAGSNKILQTEIKTADEQNYILTTSLSEL
jgi:prepilin-type N-terminal cleavage/methylation domain-containing protein